jgi:phosphoribosylformylglycinamidine synthase
MTGVTQFAQQGRPILGICNGFQILLEIGLLPGAMRMNDHLEFRCEWVYLRCERKNTPFTHLCPDILTMPIAHKEGNFYLPPDELTRLEDQNQVVFRYCNANGDVTPDANPNGSLNNIAGICNLSRNVVGMMPHPERASEDTLKGTDGYSLFRSALESLSPAG